MSSVLHSPRPQLRRAPSTTSSLAGMEKPLRSEETSPFEIYQDPIELYLDRVQVNKPLPPTPRKPSSVYSMHRENEDHIQHYTSQNDLLPSSVFLAPATYRSSTSRLPDPVPIRPKLTREAQTHAVSDPVIERRRNQKEQQGVSTHMTNLHQEWSADTGSTAMSRAISSQQSSTKGAEQFADNYTSVLHTRSSVMPTFTTEEYHVTQQQPLSPMSPRITDVVDQSLMPAPLQFISFEESERPPSRFSSSSSEVGSHSGGIRNSLRGVARKAFHLKKESQTTGDTDWAAFDRYQERRGSTPRRQSRLGSLVSQRRASIQQSIAGMYDTLANLTTTSKGAKPPRIVTEGSAKHHKPRIRSPAIPLSPYQIQGPKVWETSSKSSKKTMKSEKPMAEGASHVSLLSHDKKSQIRFSTPVYNSPLTQEKEPKTRSMVNKLASAFQSGTVQMESAVGLNTTRVKRTKSEKKRQELKGKIKVIGLGDQRTDTSGGQWL
ncbi:MAG: hypothetical protein L6R40_001317 [Gallowayella cf. fulva]|nr:MAG: hypothetical protein L6R40_001317 [Xanthomendoza cf. fulva]